MAEPAPLPRHETSEYALMMQRMIRAYARRVSTGDIDDVAGMIALGAELDELVGQAVRANRAEYGTSWAQVGQAAGISRQAAQQRWGQPGR